MILRLSPRSRMTHPHEPDLPEVRLQYATASLTTPQEHRQRHRVCERAGSLGACSMTVQRLKVFPVRSLNGVAMVLCVCVCVCEKEMLCGSPHVGQRVDDKLSFDHVAGALLTGLVFTCGPHALGTFIESPALLLKRFDNQFQR